MNSSRTTAYAVSALATAVGLFLVAAFNFPVSRWLPLVILIAFTLVSENFAFELPVKGSVSLSFALVYAALLLDGPLACILCVVASAMTVKEMRTHTPIPAQMFNLGQLVLSAGTAGIMYIASGGDPLFSAGGVASISLPAALAAAVTFYVVNVSLVTLYMAAKTDQSFLETIRQQGFIAYAASLVVLALLGLMIASLLSLSSWLGLGLLVLPFMAARRTFRVYAELSEAYTSTVRSLVTAIEAKDPYTRGHSERVAVYARKLAERMALQRADIELLERAALLHDVGKIGIELDTLTSPAQLTAEEVRVIRGHPVIGSELVGDVEFLSDVVPIVRHHHERFDGAGYPDGLIGESTPLLARVLAVADSYDAMTSDRAYRPGMSQEQALVEIARVAGRQLDRNIARQFSALIADGPVEGIG